MDELHNTYIDLAEVAQRLGCCARTIRSYMKAGGLPAYRLGGKLFFKAGEIDAWVESHRVHPVNADALAAELCNDIAAKRGDRR